MWKDKGARLICQRERSGTCVDLCFMGTEKIPAEKKLSADTTDNLEGVRDSERANCNGERDSA